MALLAAIVLTLGAGLGAVLAWRARAGQPEPTQRGLFCAVLGFVLAAASGLMALGLAAGQAGLLEADIWLRQATSQLGVPLIALAVLTAGRRWHWSGPTWGRVVLGLCVFFELARQIGWSQPYALVLAALCALAVLSVALLDTQGRDRLLGLLAGALLLGAAPWPGHDQSAALLFGLTAPALGTLLRHLHARRAAP